MNPQTGGGLEGAVSSVLGIKEGVQRGLTWAVTGRGELTEKDL